MFRLTTREFSQDVFYSKYYSWFGKDTREAINKHFGLCQALCIIVALKGHTHPMTETFFTESALLKETFSEMDLSELKKSDLRNERVKNIQRLIDLIEEVAIKAHPQNVLSTPEMLYRMTFDKLSLTKETYENKNLLIYQNKQHTLDRTALSNLLASYTDNQYIQLSLVRKNFLSLLGHATLIFKENNVFYFFDPSRGLFCSEDFNEICNDIDNSIKKPYKHLTAPISLFIIDVQKYLELYKGHDWIKKMRGEVTFPVISQEEKQEVLSLHSAIKKGSSLLMKIMLEDKAYVNAVIDHLTPLELAIKKADFRKISLLLEYNAEVKESTLKTLSDPEMKSFIILKLILRHIKDFPTSSDFTEMRRQYIIQQSLDKKPIWTDLLKHVVNMPSENKKSMFSRFYKGDAKSDGHKQYFASEKALEDVLFPLEEKMAKTVYMHNTLLELEIIINDKVNPRALLLAVQTGKLDIVKAAIDVGAEAIGYGDDIGLEVYTAAINGQYEIVRMLYDNSKKINLITRSYFPFYEREETLTALLAKGDAKMVELLCEYPDAPELFYAWNIFRLLVLKNHFDGLKILCEHANKIGLDINKKIDDSGTVLHLALLSNNPKIVQLLCDAKSDVNAASVYGDTPLSSAIDKGNDEIVAILLNAKADPNLPFTDIYQKKFTPLEYAIKEKKSDFKITKLLIDYGAFDETRKNSPIRQLGYFATTDENRDTSISCSEDFLEKSMTAKCKLARVNWNKF